MKLEYTKKGKDKELEILPTEVGRKAREILAEDGVEEVKAYGGSGELSLRYFKSKMNGMVYVENIT